MRKLLLALAALSAAGAQAANFTLSRHPRYLVYPPRGAFKLVAGLAIPWMTPPGKYLAWTINFQFQYALPIAFEQLQLPRVRRSLRAVDRPALYSTMEEYLEGRGLPGRTCLQRMVCEAAKHPVDHDGVIGKIFQIALTPSRGNLEEKVHSKYHEAEARGRRGDDCRTLFGSECPMDILGLVSEVHDEL
ncbi:uncharacterized protein LOC132205325 [Neocloeon triangulifer]|uniref:uncharacterized protein LOC132205325 n=1 Tax=Neocloeon triangulifer TaxID=2078957 RepID=UPI00286EDB6A|nr:uncharacterized protein LOC132205325 [Neocloeon triangulifer]